MLIDVINFKAYLMDRAGNRIEGSASATPLTVDETDPGKPVIELKNSSDTGIANWDNLTSDFNPTFTLNLISFGVIILHLVLSMAWSCYILSVLMKKQKRRRGRCMKS